MASSRSARAWSRLPRRKRTLARPHNAAGLAGSASTASLYAARASASLRADSARSTAACDFFLSAAHRHRSYPVRQTTPSVRAKTMPVPIFFYDSVYMSDSFEPPRIAINRVYTRQGDSGETALAGGQRVPKDGLRITAYGTVDELNSFLGVARASTSAAIATTPQLHDLEAILLRVQHELFNLGSILATLPEDVHPKQARITDAEVSQLELDMDRMNEALPPLRSFVLPGGCRLNAELHVCRTVCRRAERDLVSLARSATVDGDILKYLNRLSDALFVWSRWASAQLGAAETLWEPNQASSQTV